MEQIVQDDICDNYQSNDTYDSDDYIKSSIMNNENKQSQKRVTLSRFGSVGEDNGSTLST